MLFKRDSLHYRYIGKSKTMYMLLFLLLSYTSLSVKGFGNEEILGKGRWLVLNNLQCEDPDQYELKIDITRRKINRTHDGFNIYSELDREINVTYGIDIIANKEVDGGFKFYQKLSDDSFCHMIAKYTGDNWPIILSMGKVDPPDCPIPEGVLDIKDFVLDYRQIEETGMYGTYDVYVYILYMGQKVSCSRWLVRFEKQREDDDEDDEDDDYSF